MEKISVSGLMAEVEDWRLERCRQYELNEILFIAFCALISGAEGFTDMEDFGKERKDWLKKFFALENGIPSHDTFRRIFMQMKPESFLDFFVKSVLLLLPKKLKEGISIDGKKLRGIKDYEHKDGKYAFYIVNAFSHESGLCLGQKKVKNKSNEITAIPELLTLLDIEGKVITIDAMGTQTKIADQIIGSRADYVLSVKKNQEKLFEEIEEFFAIDTPFVETRTFEQVEKGHGRIEKRTFSVSGDLRFIEESYRWKELKSVVKVQSDRFIVATGETQSETRYFISSLAPNAELIGKYIRGHWSVENNLHWVLDVVFNEDASRVRTDNAPENLSLMRKLALNFVKNAKGNSSIKRARYKATMSEEFLEQVIFQNLT